MSGRFPLDLPGAASPEEVATLPTPSLRRRAASLLYEGVVLFGVSLLPGILATLAAGLAPRALPTAWLAQAIGFVCFGLYFVWCWTRSGQTLPMQTWRLRVVTADGRPLSSRRAWLRYLAAWLWVAPAIVLAHLAGWDRGWALGAACAWALLYGSLAAFSPHRQFLHDALCGTRLVQLPSPGKSKAQA